MRPLTTSRLHGAQIDLAAVRDNAALLAEHSGGDPIVIDLAADAYGHGAPEVERAAREGALSVGIAAGTSTLELYGFRATSDGSRLRPAMRVTSVVVGTKTIDAGEGVSYGYTWRAPRRTNLALIGIGYAEGVTRSAGNRSSILLGGALRPIVGRVAMNALVVDLEADRVSIGDEAVLFGDPEHGEPSAREWADSLGITVAEAVSGFGAHLPRSYVGEVTE